MFLFSGSNSDAKTIAENSPYPEFIYTGSSAVSLIVSHNSGKDIPSFLFTFIDGVYTNANSPEQMAIKTPIWFIAKLMSNENMEAKDGYIFVNSHYVGKPDTTFAKYLTYTDAIVYSKEYIIGMKLHDNYTDVEMIMSNPDEAMTEMFGGLKSIGGIKVIQSNVENKDNIAVVNMRLNAPLEYIINNKLNPTYIPIEVSVNGWYKKDQNTYTRGRYDKLYIQVLPVNKETMKKIIKKQMGMQNLKEMNSYNGWDVEEYSSTLGNEYICYKELEYGTVCVITNNLIYLNDISISELK